MPLGADLTAKSDPVRHNGSFTPVSMSAAWQTVIDPGGVTVQDAATITNPDTQITASTRHKLLRGARGTSLLLRMRYDDALTVTTAPVVKVFGKSSGDVAWQLLKTRAAALNATLSVNAADTTDGTDKFTIADFDTLAWDCLGCDTFLVGIETALAGTGTTSTATIEAKLI